MLHRTVRSQGVWTTLELGMEIQSTTFFSPGQIHVSLGSCGVWEAFIYLFVHRKLWSCLLITDTAQL